MNNETLRRIEAKQFELEYKLDSIIGFFEIPLKDQKIEITENAITTTFMNKEMIQPSKPWPRK